MTTLLPLLVVIFYLLISITFLGELGKLTTEQSKVVFGHYYQYVIEAPSKFYVNLFYINAVDNLLLIVVVFTGIVVSLIYLTIFRRWTTNDIVTPVKELLYSMKRIGEGHLDSQAIVRTNDEIGELTEGYNQMASELNNYISRISRMNESYYRFVPLVATLEMRRVLIDFNELLKSEGKKPIEFGTGIHTGNLMLGIVGGYEEWMER